MSNKASTPPPWGIEESGDNHLVISRCEWPGGSTLATVKSGEANARLMASAPILYIALYNLLSMNLDMFGVDVMDMEMDKLPKDLRAAVMACRLAKLGLEE